MKNLIKKLIVLALPVALAMSPFATFAGVINVNTVYSTTGTKEATVYGSVNPGGVMTTAWFEYSEDMNFLNYSETNHIFVGSQGNEFPVRATIKNLKPDSIYYVRIVADNTMGTVRGNTIMITTNPIINNQVVNIVNTNGTVASVNTKKVVETKIVYVNTNNLNNNSNLNQNTNPNYNSNYYSNSNYNQSANALFGGDFLPNTFFGWLILLLIFLAILSILRRILFYY